MDDGAKMGLNSWLVQKIQKTETPPSPRFIFHCSRYSKSPIWLFN